MTDAIPPARKEREKQRHRQEILEAAEELFAEKGFHGTTIEDIASQAEFSVGTLYNFFASKELLYEELIRERFAMLATVLHERLDEADGPISAMNAYVRTRTELTLRHEAFAKLYTRERMNDRFINSVMWRESVEPVYGRLLERLAGFCREGIAAEIFSKDYDPDDLAIMLDSLCDTFLYLWLTEREKTDLESKNDVILKLFFEGARRR